MTNTTQSNGLKPTYRYALKSKIVGAGYRTLTDFSRAIHTDLPRMSKIINGWEVPSFILQDRIAKGLNLTMKELKEIL